MNSFDLALSGGGARGAFQFGALQALNEISDVSISAVHGCSIGSINAALWLTDKMDTGRTSLSQFWQNTKPMDLFDAVKSADTNPYFPVIPELLLTGRVGVEKLKRDTNYIVGV